MLVVCEFAAILQRKAAPAVRDLSESLLAWNQ